MKLEIEIPNYNPKEGFEFIWEEDFEIEANINKKSLHIKANKAGLISLARHLLLLAQDPFNKGYHIHLDEDNSLIEGSCQLVIEKI